MKYLITENQQKRFLEIIRMVLKNNFSHEIICDYLVFPKDEDEEPEIMFDVYIVFNLSMVREKDTLEQQSISRAIREKIKRFIMDYFSLGEDKFFVGSFAKECEIPDKEL